LLALRESVQGIIDGELPCQSILIREAHRREALRNGTQANPLWCHALLALDVRSADDES